MSTTLTMPTQIEYRIERGGVARRVYGAKRKLERAQHTLVIAATDAVSTTVPPEHHDWAYDLRRGRMRIYGGLLRFIDLLHRRGFQKETALMIPSWIAAYIEDVWSDRPAEQSVPRDRAA